MIILRFDRRSLDPELKDAGSWPGVDPSLICEEDRATFMRREKAIRHYLSDMLVKVITEETGIPGKEIRRLFKRCIKAHSDGRIWGFRALIPWSRQKSYERIAVVKPYPHTRKAGSSGALSQLFSRFQHIQELVDKLFLKQFGEGIVHEARIPVKSIHKHFLKACREVGLTARDYPFSAKYLGYWAIWDYLHRLLNSEMTKGVAARHGHEAALRLKASGGGDSGELIMRPYQRVQFDAHRIDLFCTVTMPSPYGGFVERVLDRLWLLVVIEVATRAILGYHISLNREYTADDVLLCVRNAITPWKRKDLTIPDLEYPQSGGMPSDVIPELAWAVWQEFSYDNALANLADKVRDRLANTLGCAVNAGLVNFKELRAIVERFFQTLEENSFHRLPSTTGSGPDDPRRNDPEREALRLKIKLEHIEELADVVIYQYNGTPHSGIGYRSPLEYLQFFINEEDNLIRTVPEAKRGSLHLLNIKVTRVVRGNIRVGRRPYVEFEGARYQNDVLARTPDLIGTQLTLSVDPDDPRSLMAYLPDGSELGRLTAHGVWGRVPHTLEIRKAILALRHRRLLWYAENQDPVQVYMDYLASQATGHKKAVREYVKTQRSVKNTSSAPIPPPGPPIEEPDEHESPEFLKTLTF